MRPVRASQLLALPALLLALGCGGSDVEVNVESPAERYSALLEASLEHGLPGIVLAVDRRDEEPWIGAAGHADLLTNRTLTVDDPFHLASVTKAVTAVATLRWTDHNAHDPGLTLVELLPYDLVRGLDHADRITMRHLLEHSSGLYSFNNEREYWSRLIGPQAFSGRGWTTDELLDFVRANPPSGEPGSGFYYADTNYLLLGEVLAELAGKPFQQVVREQVFEPLGMESAYYYSSYRGGNEPNVRPPTEGYLVLSDIIRTFEPHPDLPVVREDLLQATHALEQSDTAAGVVVSAPDMLNFARALFRPGFLSEPSRDLLFEPLVKLSGAGDEAGGVLRAYSKPWGTVLTAEGDGPGGVHTLLAYEPESDTIVVAFTNIFGRFDEMDFFFDRILARIFAARPLS